VDRDGGGPADESLRRWFKWARPPQVLAFATVRRSDGCAIGGTSYLEIHPEHARLEIGGTWLAAGAWGTGANVEAKLLLLQHAFGLGYQRVEFKTDALNVPRVRENLQRRLARPAGSGVAGEPRAAT
jgi:RimJ/RimL family protein N-acetyltransferase